jgi:L-lactate dehydrogenase complex protein LldG
LVQEKQKMSSREQILGKIKRVTKADSPLPDIPDFEFAGEIKERFVQSIQGNKGEVIDVADLEVFLKSNGFSKIISLAKGLEQLSTRTLPDNPHELADLEVAVIQGQFGVAENGAIWLTDADLGLRALPFITEHLVIVLSEDSLVSNMHEAYKRIGEQHSGFGLFIAGPSKTADIEQSLVIGAHGARSLRVVLV